MMCDIFINNMDAWLEGELDPVLAREMDAHYQECASCRALAQEARALRETLLGMGETPIPEGVHEAMMAAVAKERTSGKKTSRKLTWKGIVGISAAAVVLLLALPLAGSMLLGNYKYSNMSAPQQARSMVYELENGAGEKALYDMAAPAPMPSAAPAPSGMPYEGARDGMAGTGSALANDMMLQSRAMAEEAPQAPDAANYGQKIIRSASISLESRQFDVDIAAIEALVSGYGGYMQSYNVSGVPYAQDPNSYGRWANMSVRVPSESMDAFLGSSKSIGNMLDTSVWSDDITANYHDTQLQLDTLRAQHSRLLQLVAKADLVEDLIQLEAELQRIQYQIDSLTGTLRQWDDRVSYASVNINLSEVKVYSSVKPMDASLGERISDSFYQSINGLIELAQNGLVGFISLLPYMAILILMGVVVLVIVQVSRRRKKGKTSE